jgi:hypothetical protein
LVLGDSKTPECSEQARYSTILIDPPAAGRDPTDLTLPTVGTQSGGGMSPAGCARRA